MRKTAMERIAVALEGRAETAEQFEARWIAEADGYLEKRGRFRAWLTEFDDAMKETK